MNLTVLLASLGRLFPNRRVDADGHGKHTGHRVRLLVEELEKRVVPSASLLGFNVSSQDWKSAAVVGNELAVSTIGHWDAVHLTGIVWGDFEGNGQTEVAGWSNLGYWLVGDYSGGELKTTQWSSGWGAGLTFETFLAGDFTGDGKDDIAMFTKSGTWWVAVSTGSSFQIERWGQRGWYQGTAYRQWEVGDFTGDGKADVAGLTTMGTWQVGLSTGISFQPQTWLHGGTRWAGVTSVVAGDFNGDGKIDLAGFLPDGQSVVATSTGTSFTSSVWTDSRFPSGKLFYQPGDYAGDGKTDVLAMDQRGDAWVFTSTGSSFTLSARMKIHVGRGQVTHVVAGDFNGDGLDDVSGLTSAGGVWIALWDGTAFASPLTGPFGKGTWASTFATGTPDPDFGVNHHVSMVRSTPSVIISAADMAMLRNNPSYFATIFQTYQYRLRAKLGSGFRTADDQVLAFCLATLVAYQAAHYRGSDDPQGFFPAPRSLALADLLAVPKLVCNEYCYLAAQLYRVAFPLATDPDSTITMVGFSTGPFGNHSQLVFTSGGISVLGDPTLGLLVRTSFAYLRDGGRIASSAIHQPIYRWETSAYMQRAMTVFRERVYYALEYGLYPEADLIYARDLTSLP
jgi:hypothetical protein